MAKTTDKTKNLTKKGTHPAMPFSKENQPSAEAKKAGRERKRHAKRIMDEMLRYQNLTLKEFKQVLDKKNQQNLTVKEQINLKWLQHIVRNPKFLLDWINKHVPQAPAQQEISGPNGGPLQFGEPSDEDIDNAIDEDTK